MSVLNDVVHPIGGRRFNVVRVLAAYNAKADDFVAADTTAAGFTVTLPAGAAVGTAVMVGDDGGNAATNAITIGAAALIDGAASVSISTNGARLMFVFDGTTWKRELFQRNVRLSTGGYIPRRAGAAVAAAAPSSPPNGTPGLFRTPALASGATLVLSASQQAVSDVEVNGTVGGAARILRYSAYADAVSISRWVFNNSDANCTVDDGTAGASVLLPPGVGAWCRFDSNGVTSKAPGVA